MKIVSIVSARPNFVKLASIAHAVKQFPDIEHVIVHTGQHYDPLLSDVFFEQLDIPQPNYNLGVKGGDRESVIADTDASLQKILPDIHPDIVLVYGDVNGAVGAARAAKAKGIPLAHIEAGLRSSDLNMPEEHNRIEIDQLADILLCSEQSGVDHLKNEKVKGEVHFVGNTMIDTLTRMLKYLHTIELPISLPEHYAVATLHRPSNVDNEIQLERLMHFINAIGEGLSVVLPAHPRLQEALKKIGKVLPGGNVFLIDPLGYLEFISLMKDSKFIITDSGGIQEESVLLGKKCFTLRRNTERPSTIESGSNTLIDPDKEEDRKLVLAFAKNPKDPEVTIPPLWDGKAGQRILDILESL